MTFKLKDGLQVVNTLVIDSSANAEFAKIYSTDATDSTSTATGALRVTGGAAIAKALYVGGVGNFVATTASTTSSTGAIVVSGGAGVAGALNVGGVIKTFSTTNSTSVSTGSLIASGGAGIASNLNVGGDAKFTASTASTSTTTGAVVVTGGVGIGGALVVGGNLTVNGTTTTVNSTTVTVDDPIFTLGGDAAPTVDDNKDRGIEFRWHDGSTAKVGFFGYDDSKAGFTVIPDATNTSEVFSGTPGDFYGNNFYALGAFIQQTASGSSVSFTAVSQATVATVAATAIDTFAATSGRSAKYIIQITQGANYQVSEILVIHDGTTAFMTEYAILETNGSLGTLSSDISGGNVRILVTMGAATSATINITRTLTVV